MTVTASRRRTLRVRPAERRTILLVGDLLVGAAAMVVSLILWSQSDWLGLTQEFVRARAGWFVLTPLAWTGLMVNLYDVHRAGSWRETWVGVLKAGAAGVVLYLVAYFVVAYLNPDESIARRGVLYFLVLATLLTLAWRRVYISVFQAPTFSRRALIVGAGESGRTFLRMLQTLKPSPYQIVGLVDDDPEKQGTEIEGIPVVGNSRTLLERIDRETLTDILVAVLGPMNGELFQALLDAQERGVEITRMPVAYEELLGRVPIRHLESDWLLRSFVDEVRASGLYLLAKRLQDVIGAVLGLSGFLLVLPWISLATAMESGRPIFFRQQRLGEGGRPYTLVKIRTMRPSSGHNHKALWAETNDVRTTRVGAILRRTHLDEFPQFWNVLRGEMSLVGPRPEQVDVVAELEKEIPFYRARLLVKPGLTGWAQVNYGKGASMEGSAEKLEYDLYYIKHRGFLLDMWIILRTIGSVIGLRGV